MILLKSQDQADQKGGGTTCHFIEQDCEEPSFSNFSCMFLNPNNFYPIWIIIFLIYYIWETFGNKLKKHSVTKNCFDLSLFEQIVLVISKILANSRPSASNFKIFSRSLEQFSLTVGQNNFGNKIPLLKFVFQEILHTNDVKNVLCIEFFAQT